ALQVCRETAEPAIFLAPSGVGRTLTQAVCRIAPVLSIIDSNAALNFARHSQIFSVTARADSLKRKRAPLQETPDAGRPIPVSTESKQELQIRVCRASTRNPFPPFPEAPSKESYSRCDLMNQRFLSRSREK